MRTSSLVDAIPRDPPPGPGTSLDQIWLAYRSVFRKLARLSQGVFVPRTVRCLLLHVPRNATSDAEKGKSARTSTSKYKGKARDRGAKELLAKGANRTKRGSTQRVSAKCLLPEGLSLSAVDEQAFRDRECDAEAE